MPGVHEKKGANQELRSQELPPEHSVLLERLKRCEAGRFNLKTNSGKDMKVRLSCQMQNVGSITDAFNRRICYQMTE